MPNQNPLLMVNYHYIRPSESYKYPGIHPINEGEFADQLRYLGRYLDFATPEQVLGLASGRNDLRKPSVFLTFDDGLAEHRSVVAKVLSDIGVRASFFIASRPFLDAEPLTVHKIHWLRATTAPGRYSDEFLGHVPATFKEGMQVDQYRERAVTTYIYDDEAIACIKYMMNFILPPKLVDEITSEMLRERGISPKMFCDECYVTEQQIKELVDLGHVVGAHGHTHVPWTEMTDQEIDGELDTNIHFLEKVSGGPIEWLSYPYGAIPDSSRDICDRNGIKVGISLIRDWNVGGEPYDRLNRINTNEVKKFLATKFV